MRNLFLVLVLANLAFAAWHMWYAPLTPVLHAADSTLAEHHARERGAGGSAQRWQRQRRATRTPRPQGLRPRAKRRARRRVAAARRRLRLCLWSSRRRRTRPTVAAATAAGGSGAAGRCTTIGPFRELSQAATAASTLRAAGFEPEQRVAEGDIWIGYWVYIQAIPSMDEANKILAKVRESGIADSYVIPNSDSGNLVSLGVFSEISGVSRRRDEVRALGFEPHVVDRTRRATVYWVEVALRGDQSHRLRKPAAAGPHHAARAAAVRIRRRLATQISSVGNGLAWPNAFSYGGWVPRGPIRSYDMRFARQAAWTLALCVFGAALGTVAQAQDEQATRMKDRTRVAGPSAGGQGSRRSSQADRDRAVSRHQDRPDRHRRDRVRRLVHRGAVVGRRPERQGLRAESRVLHVARRVRGGGEGAATIGSVTSCGARRARRCRRQGRGRRDHGAEPARHLQQRR